MKRTSRRQRAIWGGLAILAVGPGCTHNYYYGTTGPCAPYGQAVTTQAGQVCEVPDGTVVTSAAAPIVVGQAASVGGRPVVGSAPQRVVISQPAATPGLANRFRWHRPSAESETLATPRVEGALDESTYK